MDLDEQEPDSDFDSESEYDEEVKLAEPSKNAKYNAEGIMDKLGDIKWPENVNWIDKLAVEVEREEEVDVNDDLARELSFYNQALQGTRLAFEKLQSAKIPFLRPPDYYAEMVKTDSHMEKVKGRLLAEKQRTEEAEERRKARESKRLSKEIQSQKLREREKTRKADFESVKKWRKERQKSGFGDDGADMDFGFEEGKPFVRSGKKRQPGVAPADRSGGKGRRRGGGAGGKGGRREMKDSKFGFGGKKGLKKQNTAETAGNVRRFGGGGGFKSNGNKKRKT